MERLQIALSISAYITIVLLGANIFLCLLQRSQPMQRNIDKMFWSPLFPQPLSLITFIGFLWLVYRGGW